MADKKAHDNAALLRNVPSALNVPPILVQPGVEKMDTPATIPEDTTLPNPTFTSCRYDAQKRRMPQCIAHRGYKTIYPENTMAAFRGAVDVGVQGLEMDLHITKDEVVVISHDATLKRCFGREEKIIDCDWASISDARTLQEPREPMPTLKTVLQYLAQPSVQDIWLLLDIKLDNDAASIMRLIASTIASVPAPAGRPWNERIVLGLWAARYLPLAVEHLPGFPVTHIGFSLSYARHFFSVPNASLNMLLPMLVAPGGRNFIREAKGTHKRQVYSWTVNSEDKMRWCIRRGLDGVLTDDPVLFMKTCERFDEREEEPVVPLTWRNMLDVLRVWLWVSIAYLLAKKRFAPVASKEMIERVSR